MRVVRTPRELLDRSHEAACYVDRYFLIWGSRLGVGGHAVWGHPSGADADRFTRAFELVLAQPDVHPRVVMADFRALAGVDLEAFGKVREHLKKNRAAIERLVVREAVLRPGGIAGTVVAGFYAVVPGPIETRTFTELERAIRWLDCPEAAPLIREVDRIRRERAGEGDFTDRLQSLFDEQPTLSTLAEAAQALGTSARTAQRQLRSAGTTFRRERDRARLRLAKALLATEMKLSAVALDVGFSASQHFASWFRAQTGMSPSEWRERSS